LQEAHTEEGLQLHMIRSENVCLNMVRPVMNDDVYRLLL